MGLDIYLYNANTGTQHFGYKEKEGGGYEDTTPPDPVYPKHMFNEYYLRSSYNSAGINSIFKNLGLPDLYDIFDYSEDKERPVKITDPAYVEENEGSDETRLFFPDWDASAERCKQALISLKAMGKTYTTQFMQVSGGLFPRVPKAKPQSEKEAIDCYRSEVLSKNTPFAAWESSLGTFSYEPLKVVAIIRGERHVLGDEEGVYIVSESDITWYLEALEIVSRFIQKGKELGAGIYWSA